MRISILCDNRSTREGMETGWGFSCLLETAQSSILFDTGGDGKKLLRNMRRMEKDPSKIRCLVLSHSHADHTGGVVELLNINKSIESYILPSFPAPLKTHLQRFSGACHEVRGITPVAPGVFSTGELGKFFKEQALVAEGKNYLTVVSGCAHHGVDTMIWKAGEIAGGKPILLLGGLHFFDKLSFQIRRAIGNLENLGVKKIAPCHCSGDRGMKILASAYGENFISAGAGTVVEV